MPIQTYLSWNMERTGLQCERCVPCCSLQACGDSTLMPPKCCSTAIGSSIAGLLLEGPRLEMFRWVCHTTSQHGCLCWPMTLLLKGCTIQAELSCCASSRNHQYFFDLTMNLGLTQLDVGGSRLENCGNLLSKALKGDALGFACLDQG